jgi:hypothetical protein
MGRGYRIIGFSVLLMSSAAFVQGEETKVAVSKSWDDYKVIAEKNIFSRNRTKTVVLTEEQRQAMAVPEQRYHTLRGITKQANGYVSFIEDSRTSGVTRYRKGDAVAEGKIADITLDNISYKNSGKTLKVEIGMNLEGQISATGAQTSTMPGNSKGNSGFGAMGQAQEGMGQMPGGMGQAQGVMGQMPGAMGQSQGGGQFPSMGGQTQTTGQTQGGMGQMPGAMGQSGGQFPSMGAQTQGRGQQGPGMNQSQTTGQAQTTGQSGVSGQTPVATGLSQSATPTQTTVQSATGEQENVSSDEIIQRLKEKRKKELEE